MKYLLPPSMKGIILKSKDKETYLGLYKHDGVSFFFF